MDPISDKPPFDPTKPFEPIADQKPAFDPSKPFEVVPPKDDGGSHTLLNAIRVAGSTVGQSVFDGLSGLARKAANDELHPGLLTRLLDHVAPDPFGVRTKNQADAADALNMAADYWKARNAAIESGVDPALENSLSAKSARFIANTGLMLGEGAIPEVGLPLLLSHNALQSYGSTYNATGDVEKADRAMRISLLGGALFMGQGEGVVNALNKVLPQGENAIRNWAIKAAASTGGNLATGQIINAAHAAGDAEPGNQLHAFTNALSHVTGEDVAGAAAFGALSASHKAPFVNNLAKVPDEVLQTAHANETFKQNTPEAHAAVAAELQRRGVAPAPPAPDPVVVETAEKLVATGSPETAKAVIETEQPKGGEINASSIPSPESVPVQEVRTGVDEEAPLRQPGQAPEARQEAKQEVTPQPTFRGTTDAEWEQIKTSTEPTETTVSTDRDRAAKFVGRQKRGGVLIEYKPEAQVTGDENDHRRKGTLGLNDIARVYDKSGKVIYEAPDQPEANATQVRPLPEAPAPPPSQAEVAKAAYVRPSDEEIAKREAAGIEELRQKMKETGHVPTREEAQAAVGNRDTGDGRVPDQVRDLLAQENAEAYPPEKPATPVEFQQHPVTHDKLPVTTENGVVRPVFTNDPRITAQQLDMGKTVIVPEGTEVNPAIETKFDKDRNEVVVSVNDPKYGTIADPDSFTKAYQADLDTAGKARGSFSLTQENEARQEAMRKLPPAGGSDEAEAALIGKYFPNLESRLTTETGRISQAVGDADLPRLRAALLEELRWNLRNKPGKAPPLFSIFKSVRNSFLKGASRERQASLDQPVGDDGATKGDFLADNRPESQAEMDATEQALIKQGEDPNSIQHIEGPADTEDPQTRRAGTADEGLVRKNLDEARALGLTASAPEKNSAQTALQKIAASPDVPEHTRLIAKLLLKSKVDLGKLGIKLVSARDADWAGSYKPDGSDLEGGQITINLGVAHETDVAGSLMHELAHHFTIAKLEPGYERNRVEQKAYDGLTQLYDRASRTFFKDEYGREPTPEELKSFQAAQGSDAVEHPEFKQDRRFYGTSSLREFATEVLGNPRFARMLAAMPEHENVASAGGKFRSVLDAVREFLNKLFVGTNITKDSLLDQAVHNTLTIATNSPADISRWGGAELGEVLNQIRRGEYRARLDHGDAITVHGTEGPILNFPGEVLAYLKDGTLPLKAELARRAAEHPLKANEDEFLSYVRKAEPAPMNRKQLEEAASRLGITDDQINTMTKAELEQAVFGEVSKDAISSGKIDKDGWLAPNNEFTDANTSGHYSAAEDVIRAAMDKNPELHDKFTKLVEQKGRPLDINELYDFFKKNGFLRIVNGGAGTTIYVNGRPNLAQLRMLKDAAAEQKSELVQDIGAKTITLFDPHAAFAPAAGAVPSPQVVVNNGQHTLDVPPGTTRAQMMQLHQTIGASTTIPPAQKAALQQQINVMLGPTLTLRGGKDKIAYGFDSANTIANEYSRQKANELALDFGSAKDVSETASLDRQATNAIVESGGDRKQVENDLNRVANSKDAELRAKWTPIYQHALDNFERLQPQAEHVNKLMKEQADREHSVGIPTRLLDDYVTRIYKQDPGSNGLFVSSKPNGTARYWMNGRSYEKLADAIHDGKDPVTMDVVDLVRRRIETGERAVQTKLLEEELRTIKAPDGKPIIGDTEEFEGLYGTKDRKAPEGYTTVSTGAKPLVVHSEFAPLFKMLYNDSSSNKVVQLINQYSGIAKRNTLMFDTYHVGRIMAKEIAYSKGAQRFGYEKGLSILDYSDADMDRAVAVGDISQSMVDYAREKIIGDMSRRDVAQKLIENGLNVGKVLDNVFTETAHTLPFLKNFNPWVFQKLSRGAMLQTAIENVVRNNERFPERGLDANMRQTAKEYNEVFGNLQSQGWLKDKRLQDTARVVLLAPNWAESQLKAEARGYGQLARGVGRDLWQGLANTKDVTTDTASGVQTTSQWDPQFRLGTVAQGQLTVVLGMLLANQLINFLSTGHSTFQNKDGHKLDAFIPGGHGGFFFNPFEIGAEYAFAAHKYLAQHMTTEDVAGQLINNKLSPLARGAKEFFTNRDYAGRNFANTHDRITGAVADALPFPIALGSMVEKDPRQPAHMEEGNLLKPLNDMGITDAKLNVPVPLPPGYRLNRQPGGLEKQVLQSAGLKVQPAMTPRMEMFALAHPFREDQSYGDSAPRDYQELRKALDNNQLDDARTEVRLLVKRGKALDEIRNAAPFAPEKFTGTDAKETLFRRRLTPDQKLLYRQAQMDHKDNAKKLTGILRELRPELKDQLKANQRHRTGKDVAP